MPASKKKSYNEDALKQLQAATEALRVTVSLANLSDTMRAVTADNDLEILPDPVKTVPTVTETSAPPDSSQTVEILQTPVEINVPTEPEVTAKSEELPATQSDSTTHRESAADGSYTDEKGRTRWKANDDLAAKLQELHDILIVGGYDPTHAARYPKLGYAISRYFESVEVLHQEKRFRQMTGVGLTIEKILSELMETGTTEKATLPSPESNYTPPPSAVLELLTLPRMGAKTVRTLYADYGIGSLQELSDAIGDGRLKEVKGLGPALKKALKVLLADSVVPEETSPVVGESANSPEQPIE